MSASITPAMADRQSDRKADRRVATRQKSAPPLSTARLVRLIPRPGRLNTGPRAREVFRRLWELFARWRHYRIEQQHRGGRRRCTGRYEQRRSLDARVPARLADRIRRTLFPLQRPALRILPSPPGQSATRRRPGAGDISGRDSRGVALRAARTGANLPLRHRAEAAGSRSGENSTEIHQPTMFRPNRHALARRKPGSGCGRRWRSSTHRSAKS